MEVFSKVGFSLFPVQGLPPKLWFPCSACRMTLTYTAHDGKENFSPLERFVPMDFLVLVFAICGASRCHFLGTKNCISFQAILSAPSLFKVVLKVFVGKFQRSFLILVTGPPCGSERFLPLNRTGCRYTFPLKRPPLSGTRNWGFFLSVASTNSPSNGSFFSQRPFSLFLRGFTICWPSAEVFPFFHGGRPAFPEDTPSPFSPLSSIWQ